ncbi:glutathione S-transferase family protein [Seohaeicola zhoushanensis]|uniref:glutathione S-transferase family protein n=1 Tax=Seohaeicola zhoushanensis TaxID=1569283 RepID=UPI001678FCE0|nr:glutathione S-transferase [Seohaeicola zhoushanensis]
MILVHHLNNSRSQRILWLLEELELSYDLRRYERDPVTNLAPPELAAVHPLGKSPVVEIDGRRIAESGAIVEFLCLRHGRHLLPRIGSDEYVTHMELMHFAEGSAMTPILLDLYAGRLGPAGAPLRPRIDQQLTSHFEFMERMLRPSGHFVLDDLSAVDIMLSFPAEIAVKKGRNQLLPRLTSFVEAMHARPAWHRAMERGGAYSFA